MLVADAVLEGSVAWHSILIQARAQNCDCSAAVPNGSFVSDCVNPKREATDNGHIPFYEETGDPSSQFERVGGSSAGPNHRDSWAVLQQCPVSTQVKTLGSAAHLDLGQRTEHVLRFNGLAIRVPR